MKYPVIPEQARTMTFSQKTEDERLYRCSGKGGHYVPRSHFHTNRKSSRGFNYRCIQCCKESRETPPQRKRTQPDAEGMMICRKCDQRKPEGDFRAYRGYYRTICKSCENERLTRYNRACEQDPVCRKKRRDSYRKCHQRKSQHARKERDFNLQLIFTLIQRLRERGYSKARCCRVAGISVYTLMRWEKKEKTPHPKTAREVLDRLQEEYTHVVSFDLS